MVSAYEDGYLRLWDVETGALIKTFATPKPYAGTNITGVTGITAAQKQALRALGACDQATAA